MLLPQSSAFAALKNRLNSVSSIGYLHTAPRSYVNSSSTALTPPQSRGSSIADVVTSFQGHTPRSKSVHDTHAFSASSAATPSTSNYDRPNRLKGREEGPIRWEQLLEKFRSVQDKARRVQRLGGGLDEGPDFSELRVSDGQGPKDSRPPVPQKDPTPAPAAVPPKRSGLGRQFGRLGGAVAGRGKKQ